MKKAILAAAILGVAASPAHAIKLDGLWTGTIASGTYTVDDANGRQTFDITGGSGQVEVFDQDDDEGVGTAEISAGRNGIGNGAFGLGGGSVLQASNGLFRMRVSTGSDNSSAVAFLTADIVNKQLVNWRGRIEGGGQLGTIDTWNLIAEMPSMTFTGTYAGPIPEPASWAMMIVGFALAGTAARRRAQWTMVEG